MYTPEGRLGVSSFFDFASIMQYLPLDKPSHFSLDTAGVTSLLGGEDAVSAMTAIHVYENRSWLGWYNNPGSFQIAKRLNSFAKSVVSGGKFSKSVSADQTVLHGLDSYKGPKYLAAHSGTIIEQTGYLGALLMNECTAWDSEGKVVPGRRMSPVGITVAELGKGLPSEIHLARSSASTFHFASIPIISSFGTCVACAFFGDSFAASSILIGIVASSLFGLALGSADFVFTHPEPVKGSLAGDGILTLDEDIVVLKGAESAVNSITCGMFILRFSSQSHFNLIRWCSTLYFTQSIAQLFLIPQASLFGQIMFLTSIAVSAFYNAQLSSLDKEKIRRKMLFGEVLGNPALTKYTLGTRTTAVVFILLILQLSDPSKLLDELLPNDTKVWRQWKVTVVEWLRYPNEQPLQLGSNVWELSGFTQQEKDLLGLLYEDTRAAYDGYCSM